MNPKLYVLFCATLLLVGLTLGATSALARLSEPEEEAPEATPARVHALPRHEHASVPSPASVTGIITNTTPHALALAMGIRADDIISASFNGSDQRAFGVSTGPLGHHLPTEGGTFVILSTGFAETAEAPNLSEFETGILDGLDNSQDNDLVQLALRLQAPQDMNCASFDFAFYSEEFPEFVGSEFNDTFTAELGGTNLIIGETDVYAPLNFAFDTAGNIISVNTVFGVEGDTATTYDGGTSLLRAQTPVQPGSAVDIVFSVQDLGDSYYDSAVFLDKFFWSVDANCGSGAQEDSDGDGLLDVWETQGLTVSVGGNDVFLDLPTMGADPQRKDVFVEVDYMIERAFCDSVTWDCVPGHSHQPKPEAMERIIQAFADAPVSNPDGSTGINLHVDCGPDCIMDPVTGAKWLFESEAHSLGHSDELGGTVLGMYQWREFKRIKERNFPKERAPVFHYAVFAHRLGGLGCTSGISRNRVLAFGAGASDFIVSLGGWSGSLPNCADPLGVGSDSEQAGTFMHELGHNLGLRHGGDDHNNYEPNFLSTMNYAFQIGGLVIDGTNGHYDYSRFALPELDERHLNEAAGLGGGVEIASYGTLFECASTGNDRIENNANGPIDWNCNGNSAESDVDTDINGDGNRRVLDGQNDWANLVYTGGAIGQPGAEPDLPEESDLIEITSEENAEIPKLHAVFLRAPGNMTVPAPSTGMYTVTLSNVGIISDTYDILTTSSAGWADLGDVPDSQTLAAGASRTFVVSVTVPAAVGPGASDDLLFSAASRSNPLITDSALTRTSVLQKVFLPSVSDR
jgi:hypothetical protein